MVANGLIDLQCVWVNDLGMDLDEFYSRKPGDPMTLMAKQDLDPLSVDELRERLEILQAEMARVNQKIEGSVNFRASADALFKK